MKLRSRIAIAAASAVVVAVVLVTLGTYVVARRELRSEIDASLVERVRLAQRAADDIRRFFSVPIIGFPVRRIAQFDTAYYLLTLPSGESLSPPGQPFDLPTPDGEQGSDPELSDIWVEGVHLRMVSARVEPIGILTVARPLAEVDQALAGLAVSLVAIGGIASLLAGVAGLLIGRSALRPIDDLTRAAEHVAETQQLAQRIEVEGEDEVARLAASFNAMLAALEESRLQQRRLVRDAGHELRTPLTALRMNVEMLARPVGISDEVRRELVAAAVEEVEALSALVAELIDLATDRHAEEPMTAVDLGEMVAEAAERCRRRSGREVVVAGDGGTVRVRRSAVARAVDNLLDNAVKWSPEGTPIEVSLASGRVAVRDHGPGIAAEDRPKVFDRFYRADAARAMPGSGLGLSIVKQIAEDHGGSVFVEEAYGGGAV
ncbi:MAG: sensor histidine kinase, partial [Actinobacteria bacterium]